MARKKFQDLLESFAFFICTCVETGEEMQDERIRSLNRKVTALKNSRRLEEAYMTMQEMLDDQKKQGKEEGKAEGSQLMLDLVNFMLRDGLTAEISRLKEDEKFCTEMLSKYHLI
ncbi:MAG: hypothetical protein PHV18_09815 [Lachnospiraceae bacterium]|nr:hypothetical protein [Lachnospiraceae bacterium]